jgi:urate oxidase
MSYQLDASYGKQSVPVMKVNKSGNGVHTVLDMTVQIVLKGSIDRSWLTGNNSQIVPTETQKNTCYANALLNEFDCGEDYATFLGKDLLTRHGHLTSATIDVDEARWDRVTDPSGRHNHAFTSPHSPIITTCQVVVNRDSSVRDGFSVTVSSGIKNLRLLKTTQSGFDGFIVDKYTNLQPTTPSSTRMFSTEMTAKWTYSCKPKGGYAAAKQNITKILVENFAGPAPSGLYSKSLQETVYKMCTASLDQYQSIHNIHLITPNIHFYRWDAEQFGLKNPNIVFQSTKPDSTASGRIVTSVTRDSVRSRL